MELHSENKICENLKHWPQGWLYWTLSHAYFIHIVDLIWFQCLVFSLKLCQTFTAIYIFYVFFCRHSVYTAPPPQPGSYTYALCLQIWLFSQCLALTTLNLPTCPVGSNGLMSLLHNLNTKTYLPNYCNALKGNQVLYNFISWTILIQSISLHLRTRYLKCIALPCTAGCIGTSPSGTTVAMQISPGVVAWVTTADTITTSCYCKLKKKYLIL